MISECGKTFYAEFTDYDKSQVDDWIRENVVEKLVLKPHPDTFQNGKIAHHTVLSDSKIIKSELEYYFSQFESVEMWSDCLSYDWVLFCQLWGHAFNIPKNIYYIPFDIYTLFKAKGIDPDINREEFAGMDSLHKHNALWDAEVIKECHKKIISLG